jgi:hypothetical protein
LEQAAKLNSNLITRIELCPIKSGTSSEPKNAIENER